ncbi:uncharacterized protein LOC135172994 [Diachasmimorpha longicaudata]|uniref:uncharacterized protein LOC135172994 n=1 Tax=Diachasmimorpha longicaudata TaxID=58733 RepID=UPI0030B8AAC7
MFEGQELMENSSSVVFIENMEPDTVKAMLEFIYTDEVTELNPFASRLLQAARDYKLPRLITMCEMVLYKSLDIENAAELYVLANECGSIKLEENIKKFIHENFGDVSATEGYKHLPVTLLLELIKRSKDEIYRKVNIFAIVSHTDHHDFETIYPVTIDNFRNSSIFGLKLGNWSQFNWTKIETIDILKVCHAHSSLGQWSEAVNLNRKLI